MRAAKKRIYQNGGPLGPGDDLPVEGISMLPTAEVVGNFEPQDEDEKKIYDNLGVKGVMALRDMKGAVRGGRDQFAEDFMLPVLEAGLALETGAGALELGGLAAKYGPKVAQGLVKLITRNVDELGNLGFKSGMRAVKGGDDFKIPQNVIDLYDGNPEMAMEAIKRTANLDSPTTELMKFADPERLKRAQGAFGGMGMDPARRKAISDSYQAAIDYRDIMGIKR
jgi:hypothetical protein